MNDPILLLLDEAVAELAYMAPEQPIPKRAEWRWHQGECCSTCGNPLLANSHKPDCSWRKGRMALFRLEMAVVTYRGSRDG